MGYMASGKSLIGKEITEILKFDFIDLDDYIEQKEQVSVKEIFNNKGEIYFRKKEHLYLKELLSQKGNYVIALGGGTPCYSDNISLLLNTKDCMTMYLKVSIPIIIKRLISEKDKRPLIAHINSEEAMLEFVGKHLFERSHFYNQAEFVIDADKSKEATIETMLLQLF